MWIAGSPFEPDHWRVPSKAKGASMSFMHSFYAWGQVAPIVSSPLYFWPFLGQESISMRIYGELTLAGNVGGGGQSFSTLGWGAFLFAILACTGDTGASFGSWLTGVVMVHTMTSSFGTIISNLLKVSLEQAAIRFGIFVSAIFPVLALIFHLFLAGRRRSSQKR